MGRPLASTTCRRERGLDLCRAPGELPKLVGHRGALAVAPENTMASFERAWRDGADLVELDVRLSADGRVVVLHDLTLDRTTDGTGPVTEATLAELKQLDAGAWFAPSFAGERIPALIEVLAWARDQVGLVIELKYDPFGTFSSDLVPVVLADVQSAQMGDRVVCISYQTRALAQVKALAPHIPVAPMPPPDRLLRTLAWLHRRWPAIAVLPGVRRVLLRPLTFALGAGCDTVGANVNVATKLLVDAAHEMGVPVSCGGVDWDYPAAIAMGMDTVAANDPGEVRRRYLQRP